MSEQPIALVDVDGVVANLEEVWLSRYNEDWGDNLTSEDITRWSMTDFVKPECGEKIFDYLWQEDLYDDVEPMEDALEGVNTLRSMGFRVVFLTSANAVAARAKMEWLAEHGFLDTDTPRWLQHKDVIVAHDKSLVHGDLLIDDHVKNIESSPAFFRILFGWPHNEFAADSEEFLRVKSWTEALFWIDQMELAR